MTLHLRITLLSDAVFTSDASTVGAPVSLEFVPGSALLGVVASQLYEHVSPAEAWSLFHSGDVRFGCGLPAGPAGEPTIPVPLSWHAAKVAASTPPDGKNAQALRDRSRTARAKEDGQEQQVRSGFAVPLGAPGTFSIHRPKHTGSLRTAIGAEGRARNGFLYGFDALAEGSVFHARVDFAPGAQPLRDRVAAALTAKHVVLGRSRGAELGLAKIELTEPNVQPALALAPRADGRVAILLLSDTCLRDSATGAPTLIPDAQHFGLPRNWALDLRHTFIGVRSWSPFNGKRRAPDLERHALKAGSVLVFSGPGQLDRHALAQALRHGVGEHRQEGLGQVAIDPQILGTDAAVVLDRSRAKAPDSDAPHGPVADWVSCRSAAREATLSGFGLARQWANDLARYDLPGSQWQLLREQAARVSSPATYTSERLETLARHLFERSLDDATGDNAQGFLLKGVRGSEDRWGQRRGGKTAAEALRDLIGNSAPQPGEPGGAQAWSNPSLVIAMALDQLASAVDAKRKDTRGLSGGRR